MDFPKDVKAQKIKLQSGLFPFGAPVAYDDLLLFIECTISIVITDRPTKINAIRKKEKKKKRIAFRFQCKNTQNTFPRAKERSSVLPAAFHVSAAAATPKLFYLQLVGLSIIIIIYPRNVYRLFLPASYR